MTHTQHTVPAAGSRRRETSKPGLGPWSKSHDPLDQELGRRLRMRREASGMSLATLGAEVGVSAHQILKYERAVNRVSFSTLVRICRVLGSPLADLVRGIERGGGAASGPGSFGAGRG